MSKQTAILDEDNFRYIITPLKPGNVCTVPDALRAIKNSTELHWREISEYFGLKNANRSFRLAYCQPKDKISEDLEYLQEYLAIDTGESQAYLYEKDHKPAQVVPPHVGPTITSGETGLTVVAGTPELFATRVVIDDPLNRVLTMTVTPSGGYIVSDFDNVVPEAGDARSFTGYKKSLNHILKHLRFVGVGNGSASVNIAIDDREGDPASTSSVAVTITVEAAKEISTPTLIVPASVSSEINKYVDLKTVTVADTDNKVLAVRFSPFNCQLCGFASSIDIVESGKTKVVTGLPEKLNAEFAKLIVMPLIVGDASLGVEMTADGGFYDVKFVKVTGTAATPEPPEEDEEDQKEEEGGEEEVGEPGKASAVNEQPKQENTASVTPPTVETKKVEEDQSSAVQTQSTLTAKTANTPQVAKAVVTPTQTVNQVSAKTQTLSTADTATSVQTSSKKKEKSKENSAAKQQQQATTTSSSKN